MKQKALKTIEKFSMIEKNSGIVVALSGGADSMALLGFLLEIKESFLLRLYAAHVNHMLRGQESERDEAFVRSFCNKKGVPLYVLRKDIRAAAQKEGESIEIAGRNVRYEFLERLARENNCLIATAHTLSDSIETMLLNLTRGTGLRGLCGIPPKRDNIIRPLIECTREDVEKYCKDNNIEYITDSSNKDTIYLRNQIRHNVVPQLKAINPSLHLSVLRLQRWLWQDEDYLTSIAEEQLNRAETDKGYDIPALLNLAPSIRARALMLWVRRHTGRDCQAVHLAALEQQMAKGSGRVSMPGGGFAQIYNGKLNFLKDIPERRGFCLPLEFGNIYPDEDLCLNISLITMDKLKKNKKINKKLLTNSLDYDMIQGNAIITTRRQGDRYRPASRGMTKSIKKLFNEAKIPPLDREKLVVLRDSVGILWVEGFGADERCKVTDSTKRVLYIDIQRVNKG